MISSPFRLVAKHPRVLVVSLAVLVLGAAALVVAPAAAQTWAPPDRQVAQGGESDDALLGELEGYGSDVRPIGDCLAPRTAEEAVFDGLREAWRL